IVLAKESGAGGLWHRIGLEPTAESEAGEAIHEGNSGLAAAVRAVVTGCSIGGFKAREQGAGGRTHARVDEIIAAGVIISDRRSGGRLLKAPIADRTIGKEQFSITATSRRGETVGGGNGIDPGGK